MAPLEIVWQWPHTPVVILVTLAVAIIANVLVVRFIRVATRRALASADRHREGKGNRAERILGKATGIESERHQQRTATLGSLLRSLSTIVIWLVAGLTIMSTVGVPLAPLLASAGVGGVALGFGAQSLVKDFLSGIFMIIEDQYGVGDLIDTGEVTGTVEEVSLRVTRLRDMNGQVWYVRNGEIVRIGNQSQGWSTGTVDVPVAFDEDPERVIDILKQVVKQVDEDPEWTDQLLETPSVAGVNSVVGGTMTIRIFAKCPPNEQWGVQREILEQSMLALSREGIRGPVVLPTSPATTPTTAT